MQWEVFTAIAIGWLGQFLKGHRRVPTALAQVITAVACMAMYAVLVPPSGPINVWIMEGVKWSLASLGIASVTGHSGLAPKTDSL